MKKIIYKDGSYIICKDSKAWFYQNNPDWKETTKPTDEEIIDWFENNNNNDNGFA